MPDSVQPHLKRIQSTSQDVVLNLRHLPKSEKVSQEQHWQRFPPWWFPITLSFPVYLPLALRCYQVYFWRNCRRLLPKSGKISQEHHWQQECQEQFELSYATGRQSFPIDSSLLPQSEERKKNKNILCTVCNQILVYVSVSVSVTYSCLYAYKKETVVENNCF